MAHSDSRLPRIPRLLIPGCFALLLLVLAACGGEDADQGVDTAAEPEPTPTIIPTEVPDVEPTPTPGPEPTATVEETPDQRPTPTEEPQEPVEDPTPEPEPVEDIDFAPELTGLTDWRNGDPASLADLRGEPVVLVFWNSI